MAREFANSENKVGKGFAILGIYIFVVCYCRSCLTCDKWGSKLTLPVIVDSLINSVTWLYGAEVVPMSVRSRMVGVSAVAHYVVNAGCMFSLMPEERCYVAKRYLAVTEAGPSAFSNIHENYYYVFVGCCTVYLFIIYFYYP